MRKTILTILVCAFSLMAVAQQHGAPRPQQRQEFSPEQFVKEMKMFISKNAQLTTNEADRFFPLLLEMLDKTREIQNQRRELVMKAMREEQKMTESQYESTIDQICKLEIKEKQIEQQYYKKFHSVLCWKKVYKVRVAINMYHMHALSRFQRGPGGGTHPHQ